MHMHSQVSALIARLLFTGVQALVCAQAYLYRLVQTATCPLPDTGTAAKQHAALSRTTSLQHHLAMARAVSDFVASHLETSRMDTNQGPHQYGSQQLMHDAGVRLPGAYVRL